MKESGEESQANSALDQLDLQPYNNMVLNAEIIDKLLASNDLFDMDLDSFIKQHVHRTKEDLSLADQGDKDIYAQAQSWRKDLSSMLEDEKKEVLQERRRIRMIL